MSDATDQRDDATGTEEPPALPGDGLREGIVDALRTALGEQLVDTHLVPQTDLWVRVAPEAWARTAEVLKAHGFDYFCFLSGIDWMPSPYGWGEDDPSAEAEDKQVAEMRSGHGGGDSRFQVFARVTDLRRHVGVTIKADVPDSMTMPTWIGSYAGANWHERETHEMFGIGFDGHPDLRNIYLPGEFEGFPLRKDFPLLSRMVKPWPGIVDVEPMPTDATDATSDEPAAPAEEPAAAADEPAAVADESATGVQEPAAVAEEPAADEPATVAEEAAADEPTADEPTAAPDADGPEEGSTA